ncbi:hypothetical protein MTR_8g465480 [Medicago truncatula]|uniref:Uncharacterized protein n=1 Tax=Medicago truncatula TaxID=3880 RepID=A0A072TQY9_MEDTR|nr:hypothetical protein MTR_8g465480 [Medicago truncatula]
MKFPDTKSSSWFSKIMDLEECRTCSAYANLDICGRGSGFQKFQTFRLARTLLGDHAEANTKSGWNLMPSEYAIRGSFSM